MKKKLMKMDLKIKLIKMNLYQTAMEIIKSEGKGLDVIFTKKTCKLVIIELQE